MEFYLSYAQRYWGCRLDDFNIRIIAYDMDMKKKLSADIMTSIVSAIIIRNRI
jgi:hypothetical protein